MNFITKLLATLRSVAHHPLHEREGTRAAWNFCVSQVAARLVPGDVCIPFPNDTSLLVGPRMKGAAHFIFPGLCEFDTMSFVLHFLRPGELFVDAGANVGAYSVLAGGAVGGRVIAFEPGPATFPYLEKNLRLNRLGQTARAVNAALGAEEATIRFTSGLGTEDHVSVDAADAHTIEVKQTTLDAALEGELPVLLKMDVEGFEIQVMAGASRTLSNSTLQAIIIERSGIAGRYGGDEADLHARIRRNSFEPCAYLPLERKLIRLSPDTLGNIIYVRNFDVVQQRLRAAPPYRFGKHVV